MTPCVPGKKLLECENCKRYRLTVPIVRIENKQARYALAIDASTISKPDRACPFWKPTF